MEYGFSLVLSFAEGLVGKIELMGQVVDVTLEGVDLLDAGLLTRLKVTDSQLGTVNFFFEGLEASIGILVLPSYLGDSLVQPLTLQA